MDLSPELRTIDRCAESIVVVLRTDALNIALKLISKEMLPYTIADRMKSLATTPDEKAIELVSSIRGLVVQCPNRFHDFMRILEEEPWLKSVTETLSSTYSKCSKH